MKDIENYKCVLSSKGDWRIRRCLVFPRNKNAALPVRAQKGPLTISGLKKWSPDGTCGHELSRPKRVS
jgi:hypothetical protein